MLCDLQLVKVYEVWQYRTTQFDGVSGGLFVEYINKFLKLKQEASGWPEWCDAEEKKEQYLQNFFQREGVRLDKNAVKKNPGFRALAKLMLNSFWGKFGQRDNLPQTSFVNTREELLEIVTNPGLETIDIMDLTNNTTDDGPMMVSFKAIDEAITPSSNTSVVIAAYVTATARLKLYSYLEQLGERVLYFDTDSIIFRELPGQPSPPVGDYLGDLTDELADYGPGSFIDVFVSGGPKNYAYRVRVGGGEETKTVCKVKGVTLNHTNVQKVNFDVLREMVTTGAPAAVTLQGSAIARTKTLDVVTRPDRKTYRVNYLKRRRVGDYATLPYGFRQ